MKHKSSQRARKAPGWRDARLVTSWGCRPKRKKVLMVEHQIRFDDNCTRIRSSLARSWSRLGRNRERGRDSQGCDEDHGGKCAKALNPKEKARRVRVALTQAESGDCLRLLESLGAR